MKTSFVLAVFVNLLAVSMAAPNDGGYNKAADGDVSLPEEGVLTQGTDTFGVKARCGGLSKRECSAWCARVGYDCYRCTSNACQCANNVC